MNIKTNPNDKTFTIDDKIRFMKVTLKKEGLKHMWHDFDPTTGTDSMNDILTRGIYSLLAQYVVDNHSLPKIFSKRVARIHGDLYSDKELELVLMKEELVYYPVLVSVFKSYDDLFKTRTILKFENSQQ